MVHEYCRVHPISDGVGLFIGYVLLVIVQVWQGDLINTMCVMVCYVSLYGLGFG